MSAANLDLVRRLAAAEHGLLVLATTRLDNSVHASVVNGGVFDDPISGAASVAVVIRGGAKKLDHLRRTGRATVVFRAGWEWVSVEGGVRIIGPDDPEDGFDQAGLPRLLRDIFTAAGGTHDDWDTYDRVMAEERRTAVFVEATKILSN